MTYALIDPISKTVTNIIVADENFVAQRCPGAVRIDNLNPVPGIGWRYLNSEFVPPGR